MLSSHRNEDFQIVDIDVTDPAAGANWVHTPDARFREKVIAVRFELQCSAVVATRAVLMGTTPSSLHPFLFGYNGSQTANQTRVYWFYPGYAEDYELGGTTFRFGWLPQDLWINNTGTLYSNIRSIDVGDQLTDITVRVMRQISGNL